MLQDIADIRMHAEGLPGSPAPSPLQWLKLWRLWDAATLTMIPPGRHSDRWVHHLYSVLPAVATCYNFKQLASWALLPQQCREPQMQAQSTPISSHVCYMACVTYFIEISSRNGRVLP
jgi:hypothetical protein